MTKPRAKPATAAEEATVNDRPDENPPPPPPDANAFPTPGEGFEDFTGGLDFLARAAEATAEFGPNPNPNRPQPTTGTAAEPPPAPAPNPPASDDEVEITATTDPEVEITTTDPNAWRAKATLPPGWMEEPGFSKVCPMMQAWLHCGPFGANWGDLAIGATKVPTTTRQAQRDAAYAAAQSANDKRSTSSNADQSTPQGTNQTTKGAPTGTNQGAGGSNGDPKSDKDPDSVQVDRLLDLEEGNAKRQKLQMARDERKERLSELTQRHELYKSVYGADHEKTKAVQLQLVQLLDTSYPTMSDISPLKSSKAKDKA